MKGQQSEPKQPHVGGHVLLHRLLRRKREENLHEHYAVKRRNTVWVRDVKSKDEVIARAQKPRSCRRLSKLVCSTLACIQSSLYFDDTITWDSFEIITFTPKDQDKPNLAATKAREAQCSKADMRRPLAFCVVYPKVLPQRTVGYNRGEILESLPEYYGTLLWAPITCQKAA